MEPLFINITKYTKKNYEQFLEFHNKKFSFSYNFYTIIMSILLIICMILNIVQKNIVLFFIFICMLIGFLLYRLYFPMKRLEKTEKQYEENKEIQCKYSFYKWYFTLNDQRFYYFKLYKVFETDDYFYFYINDERASLVNKKSFKSGNVEDFRNFIQRKCFFKYSKT